MKKTLFMCLGLSVMVGCASDDSDDPVEQADGDPGADSTTDSLAADEGISLAEAAVRMTWQDKMEDLETALQAQLASSYGGMWVDNDHGDRVQVAMTAEGSAADVMLVAQQLGIDAGVDIVRVARSQAQLQQLSADITAADPDAAVGIDESANVVTLSSPVNAAAKAIVDRDAAAIQRTAPVAVDAMGTSFSPPLRGGVHIQGGETGVGCTAGFLAKGKTSGNWFVMTAGHCVVDNNRFGDFTGFFADHSAHGLTDGLPGSSFVYGDNAGDMAALRLINVAGWKPRPWVVIQQGPSTSYNPHYTISGTAGAKKGMHVCHTGITSLTHCGNITRTDVTVTYSGDGTRHPHQVEVKMLSKAGDSGGPVVALHKAVGLLNAGGGGFAYFEPIGLAEAALHVSVATCSSAGATVSTSQDCCSLVADHSRSNNFLTCQ